ncbi:hypothetical protein [Pseudoalteromonas luteoviolacea]|uniref:hypothetical protein n=1 Tax=Pseudoalteromonas luteoviolacea TaxID=43657 RepID=UPI001F40FE15|nr:hypothetical protein [Pseudoalteromonas luteoviolacea]
MGFEKQMGQKNKWDRKTNGTEKQMGQAFFKKLELNSKMYSKAKVFLSSEVKIRLMVEINII